MCSSRYFVVLLSAIMHQIPFVLTDSEQVDTSYQGTINSDDVISSWEFSDTRYSTDTIYIYRLAVFGGFVRVVFSDFKLDPGGILRIYDGADVNAPSIIWNSPARPVYQASTTAGLIIVIKTGSSFDEHRNSHEFYGYKMEVEYVSEHRDSWATGTNIPKRGFCPEWEEFRNGEGALTISTTSVHLDCAWNASFTDDTTGEKRLFVLMPEGDFRLYVRDGQTSEDVPRSFYPISLHGVEYDQFSINSGDYINIAGSISSGSQFKMAYAGSADRAVAILSETREARRSCPFKDCSDIVNSYSTQCVLYWNTCGDPAYDASCEKGTDHECGISTSQCYRVEDECDGWNDCGYGSDENSCHKAKNTQTGLDGGAIAGYVVMAIIFLIFITCFCCSAKKDGGPCEFIGGAVRCCCECISGVKDVLCEQCRRCCDCTEELCCRLCEPCRNQECNMAALNAKFCCCLRKAPTAEQEASDNASQNDVGVSNLSRQTSIISSGGGTASAPPIYLELDTEPRVIGSRLSDIGPEAPPPSYESAISMEPPPPDYNTVANNRYESSS